MSEPPADELNSMSLAHDSLIGLVTARRSEADQLKANRTLENHRLTFRKKHSNHSI